ncbi:MAG: GspE/PulE family protein [Candidatus Omnitrophica bacterium]|nr:GspE/PulE family protein [Candidatus Omnitrophota bacterium]MBU4473290.1 GspE/PulE family protein [Candidatus Omnitrophota bacterium]MCG2706791.1 GspE/PulE family protein [Candidatus Omnitrophota bacterium]
MPRLNIEQSLVKEGIISPQQLQTLKLEQQRSSISLVRAIRRLRLISEDILIDFLCQQLHLSKFDLQDFAPTQDLVSILPRDFLQKKEVLPLFKKNDELAVGILDPLDSSLLEELRFQTGLFIKPYLIKEEELKQALDSYFNQTKQPPVIPKEAMEEIREEGSKPSIVEAINLLLLQAVKFGASDIHIEPQQDKMRLRLRIDGVLKEITPPEAAAYKAFISRIKIMSNLDIAEKRQPQDGRFNIDQEDGSVDVRVSIIPTIQGESAVLRLLKKNKKLLTLDELGISPQNLALYLKLVRRPSGIILVTGPTGSGKTTSLYASLLTLKSIEKNIITIEDPVEYQLDFCRQIQVNPKANLLFATGLRSILRHDPDIIMVGEIRDLETATIAIQAALTGHLVLSTLHTIDAASAITRLVDMGIEPFLIASCLHGVAAQRLVRVLCKKCKSKTEKKIYKNSPYPDKAIEVYEAKGCQDCLHTGFSGRLGIFEIMAMNPQIGRMTVEKASSEEITAYCRSQGTKFLDDDGWEKIISGLTTPEELMRVLGST